MSGARIFAQQHVVWTEYQRSRVHFSDKSKFNVIESDEIEILYVRKAINELRQRKQ